MHRTDTPEIANEPGVGYISSTMSSPKMVGYWQSSRLSIAPLKPTQVSTMVESKQFGAQKATGSSYWAHDQ